MARLQSDVREALKRLARNMYESSTERDQLLEVVAGAETVSPDDVLWMLFRPDRAVRSVGAKLLTTVKKPETVDLFIKECDGKPDSAVRAAAGLLFQLSIPGAEARLAQLYRAAEGEERERVRRVVFEAPATRGLEPLFWQLASAGTAQDRLQFLDRLATLEMSSTSFTRWRKLAHDEEREVREKALSVLAEKAAKQSVDLIVKELPRVGYATQQRLIDALTRLAKDKDADFADQLLPLMASGDAGTRSAVLKILVGMRDRREVIRRYLKFSKSLAGWARDRALDSMREFGSDLMEPTLELLADPDEDVRAAALVVGSSFDDPRIVPPTIELLRDQDWWMRISAADTLGRLKDRRAVEPLVNALTDPEVRWAAVEALGRIGDVRSLPALGQLLKDPAPEIRIEVVMALRNFKHPKILPVLKNLAANDSDRNVRARALETAEAVARRDKEGFDEAGDLREQALKISTSQDEPQLDRLLKATRNRGASDLHLSVSRPPMVRVAGELMTVKGDPFSAEQTEAMVREILTEGQMERLQAEQQLDFCHYIPKAGRYRANVFLDQRGYNGVFRVIPEKPPTIAEIGLPNHLAEIADYHQGLVLVCGPSGSGKSTTLTALVNLFNETRQAHVISLEDPVEFVHPFKMCLVNQREVGSHTRSFARALRAALREDPDVIVIGDLRDNESVSLALTAAETGHIVLGTLNATNAYKAVDRIITSFAAQEQAQIRTALSESLKFVIAQRLLPGMEKHQRVGCFEVLRATRSVAAMIRDEKTFQIPSAMQIGRQLGMQTFDEALKQLVRRAQITPETAYMAAEQKKEFEALVPPEFLESATLV